MIIDIPIIGSTERSSWVSASTHWYASEVQYLFINPLGHSSRSVDFNYRASVGDPLWFQVNLQAPKPLKAWGIKANGIYNTPGSCKIFGSSTGAFAGEEVELQDITGAGINTSGLSYVWHDYTIDTPQSFQYYKMLVTEWDYGTTGYYFIQGMRFDLAAGENAINTDTDYEEPNMKYGTDWIYTRRDFGFTGTLDVEKIFRGYISAFVNDFGWNFKSLDYPYRFLVWSNGTDGDQPPSYARIEITPFSNSFKLYMEMYGYWDFTTDTGNLKLTIGLNYDEMGVSFAADAGHGTFLIGNKDTVTLADYTSRNTSYNEGSRTFGHLHKDSLRGGNATLSSDVPAATDPVIAVSDSTAFYEGGYFCIWGASGEGRDYGILVEEVVDSTHIRVNNIPRDYSSGSWIGVFPNTFYYTGDVYYHFGQRSKSGLSSPDGNDRFSYTSYANNVTDPAGMLNKHVIAPFMRTESNGVNPGVIAMSSPYEATIPAGINMFDVILVGTSGRNEGTSTSGTATTITDSTKNWSTNEHVGKLVYLSSGPGYHGAINCGKIISNTSTSITVEREFMPIAGTGTAYHICEEMWASVSNTNTFLVRLGA